VLADKAGIDAFENVAAIFDLALSTSAETRLQFDPSLARGLSYYTGAIMEINVPDLAGSLGGGGRYDNLVGMFLGQEVPACGFSLGLERMLVVMGERGMFPESLATTPADVMVAVFDAKDAPHALRLAALLRTAGLRVLVYPDADKIGKQIKYADSRSIPFVALLGSDEIAGGTVTVKNLSAQTQQTHDQAAAGAAILEALTQRG
jgi:histidyl-tRNA synthetase